MAECPLCSHPKASHVDGVARRTLDAMGCASCLACEDNRQALTQEALPCKHPAVQNGVCFWCNREVEASDG